MGAGAAPGSGRAASGARGGASAFTISPPAMVMAAPVSACAHEEAKSSGGTTMAATSTPIWRMAASGFLSPPPASAARKVTICPARSRVSAHAPGGTGRPLMYAAISALPLRCLRAESPGASSGSAPTPGIAGARGAAATSSPRVAPGGTVTARAWRPCAVSGCGQISVEIFAVHGACTDSEGRPIAL